MVGKKTNLPLFGDERPRNESARPAKKKPSLEAARKRLGGPTRGGSAPPVGLVPGRVVRVTSPTADETLMGVVVFACATEVHALLDGMRLLRVGCAAVEPFDGEAPGELARIAADAHVFGLLSEGQAVRYADDATGLLEGKLVEKCRYGGLVVRADGTLVAVGFRKLWPAVDASIGAS